MMKARTAGLTMWEQIISTGMVISLFIVFLSVIANTFYLFELLIAKAKQKAHNDIGDAVPSTLPCWLNQSCSRKHVTFHLAFQTFPQLKTNTSPSPLKNKTKASQKTLLQKQNTKSQLLKSLILVSLSLMTNNWNVNKQNLATYYPRIKTITQHLKCFYSLFCWKSPIYAGVLYMFWDFELRSAYFYDSIQ